MMTLPKLLNPAHIFHTLDAIDNEAPSYSLNRQSASRRVFWTLACVASCLLIIHYLKYFTSFKALLEILSIWSGESSTYYYNQIRQTGFLKLASFAWWTTWHVIGYVIIPFFVVRFLFKESFLSMGWRWHQTHQHVLGYALLLSPILIGIFLVSFRSDFLNHYPFYTLSHRSWFDLLSWEVLYLTQFVCLEFFFRGFILNALRPAIGANAIWVMCVPYLMIHFPKLWIEATGAIFFGLFLGLLALRSRSIWGGFLVHAGVALTMDFASLYQQDRIPSQFWPF